MTEQQQEPTDEDLAPTAGEEDHSDVEQFRGDEADSPVDEVETELVDTDGGGAA